MNINDIIIYIVAGFFCLGALDKCLGNKWGLGQRFTDGFMAMGPLTFTMVGIISLAPVLAAVLTPVVVPVYSLVGADPASFANTILALDMGGYSLAKAMSQSDQAELFSWVFLGTMLGPTVAFTIPVALGIIEKEDYNYFAKGILLGLITVPVGCLAGGLLAGIDVSVVLRNLIIPFSLSILLSLGLWKRTNQMVIGFSVFGKGVQITAITGLAAIAIETLTGFVVIPNMTPLEEGVKIVGSIALFLAGAFPMMAFISKVFKKLLTRIGAKFALSDTSTAGFIASFAHVIPMLTALRSMEPRGKVLNVAFAVSGAFVFGGHLGFVAGIDRELAFAVIAGKLIGGFSAVMLALIFVPKESSSPKSRMNSGGQSFD
ncbi:ethanolamine utilization protein EutH [Sediminibacillus albus]|uniref:Ethanolamine transporter n=1 Tax=Sediminibacillus albus TaxID=407036 RepID=A0A1G9ANN2_9BACI|nr:ethanolamine utilization protein EutH [Sediminibacillus albus]SDK28877.1 ethanolamine transporter [Sediminibacillus albus]